MKTNLQTIGILVLGTALCGCESMKPEGFTWSGTGFSFDSDRRLVEPERAGAFAAFSSPSLRRIEEIPTEIRFVCDVKDVLITKRMAWGTSEIVAHLSVDELIRREFVNAVSAHFHPIAGDQVPAARLSVEVLSVFLTKEDDHACSEMALRIGLHDLTKNVTLKEREYRGSSALPWDSGSLVPDSVYECVQKAASEFLKDLCDDRGTIARLEKISPDAANVKKPTLSKFEAKHGSAGGILVGSCEAQCNDWDDGRTANWLRSQLERRCCDQLGVEQRRVRVIYDTCAFDGAARAWKISFAAFARSEMVLDYNAVTHSGTCAVDYGMMGKPVAAASDALKDYVMKEMDRRAGAQQTGRESPRAQVRFDDFRTDRRYAIAYCSFHVVY